MQIQIPNFEGHNQQYARDQQNALVQQSRLKTDALQQNALGMRNQDMAKEQADRAELEQLLMSTPPEQRERAGLEFLKQRDPEKALRLQAQYFHEFVEKGKIDPKTAAADLERKTGEKIQIGGRYAKIPTDDGRDHYRDMLTGQEIPLTAQVLAEIQHGYRTEEIKTREKEKRITDQLKPDKPEIPTPYKDFASGDPARRATAEEYMKTRQDVEAADLRKVLMRLSIKEKQHDAGGGDNEDISTAAQAIVSGRMAPSQLSIYGRSKLRSQIMAKVYDLDPEFDAMKAESGRVAGDRNQKVIRSIDAADSGLNTVLETSKQFNRSDIGVLNNIILKGEVQMNDPKAIRFQTAINSVIDDVASVLSGGGATTDAARAQATRIFHDSYSKGGLEAAIETLREVLKTRREAFSAGTAYEKKGETPSGGGGGGAKAEFRFDPTTGQLVPVKK